jgi:hypothetical protein
MKKSVAILMIIMMVMAFGFTMVSAATSAPATPKASVQVSPTPAVSPSPSPSLSPSKDVSPSTSTQTNDDKKTNDDSNIVVQGADTAANAYVDEINGGFFGQSERIWKGNPERYFSDWNNKYRIDFVEQEWYEVGLLDINVTGIIANMLFGLQKYTVELLIKFMDLAFDKDASFTWLFNNTLNNMIGDLYSKVFKVVIGIAIALVGFYIAWNLIKNDKNRIFQILVKTVILVAAAEYFYTHPIETMTTVDNVVNDVSLAAMSSMYSNSSDENKVDVKSEEDVPIQNIANSMFKEYIHTPWQILEFGSVETAEKDKNQEKILDAPNEDERQDNYKELQEEYKFTDSGARRSCFIVIYMVPVIINLFVLAFLTFLTIAYKFYLLFIIFIGIFVFPLSFVPSIGPNIIKEWGQKVIGVACMKIVISILFILVLQFNQTILNQMSTKNWSWITLLFIQAVIYTVIFVKRNVVKDLFNRTKRAMAKPRMAGHYMRGYMDSIGKEVSVKGTAAEVKDAAIVAQQFGKTSGRRVKNTAVLGYRAGKKAQDVADDAAIGVGKTGIFGEEIKTEATKAEWEKRAERYTDSVKEENGKGQNGKSSNSNSTDFVNSTGGGAGRTKVKSAAGEKTYEGMDIKFEGSDKVYHYKNKRKIAYVKHTHKFKDIKRNRKGGKKNED